MTTTNFYQPFSNMKFDFEHCFLCGEKLNNENRTMEHIFPKWLQHKHELWNQKIRLTNGKNLYYRKLTIPCCKACNGGPMSRMEETVKKAFEKGYDEFEKLDDEIIFKWLTKIYYGMIFKNLSLKVDVRDRNSITIVTPKLLERYKMVHELLQSIRHNVNYEGKFFSLFKFKVHNDANGNHEQEFHFSDDLNDYVLSLRSGDIGLIICIGDDGIVRESFDKFVASYNEVTLHTIQYLEMVGRVFYRRSLLLTEPSYMFVSNGDKVTLMSMMNSYENEYFAEENNKILASSIARQWHRFGIRLDHIYDVNQDAFITYLVNQRGFVHVMDEHGEIVSGIDIKVDLSGLELLEDDPREMIASRLKSNI